MSKQWDKSDDLTQYSCLIVSWNKLLCCLHSDGSKVNLQKKENRHKPNLHAVIRKLTLEIIKNVFSLSIFTVNSPEAL